MAAKGKKLSAATSGGGLGRDFDAFQAESAGLMAALLGDLPRVCQDLKRQVEQHKARLALASKKDSSKASELVRLEATLAETLKQYTVLLETVTSLRESIKRLELQLDLKKLEKDHARMLELAAKNATLFAQLSPPAAGGHGGTYVLTLSGVELVE